MGMWYYDNVFNILYKIYWLFIFIATSVILSLASLSFIVIVWGDLILLADSLYFSSELLGVVLKIWTVDYRNMRTTIEALDSKSLTSQSYDQDKYVAKSMWVAKRNILLVLGSFTFHCCLRGVVPFLTDAFENKVLPEMGWYYIDTKVSPNYEIVFCIQVFGKFACIRYKNVITKEEL